VIYAGNASKSLAPGVRLGWLVVPGVHLDRVLEARAHGDWPSALDQLTLAELISSGGYDRHVRRMRIAYRRRRDRLLATVPRITGIDAGLHAVVDDERAVVRQARRWDLVIEGFDAYRFGPASRGPALVPGGPRLRCGPQPAVRAATHQSNGAVGTYGIPNAEGQRKLHGSGIWVFPTIHIFHRQSTVSAPSSILPSALLPKPFGDRMPNPSESTSSMMTDEVLSCLECSRSWVDVPERWRLYVTADTPPQLLLYCPHCARREFD